MQTVDPNSAQTREPQTREPQTRVQLQNQLKETDEAISAAYAARESANSALEQLEKADNWATWDVWGGSGLITHMMKYDKIDRAQEEMELLNANLRNLQRQLADISIGESIAAPSLDSTTQVVDFLFDNIFTDLRVRDEIRSGEDRLTNLLARLDSLIARLQISRREIEGKLSRMG